MKYSEARPLMQTGDAIAFSGTSFFSKSIKLWQKYVEGDIDWYLSHVALVMRTDTPELKDRVFLVEATRSAGLAPRQLSLCYKDHGAAYWLKASMTAEQRSKAYEYAVDKVTRGIKYDLKGCLATVLGPVFVDAERYFCSEFVWDDYIYSGYQKRIEHQIAPTPGEMPSWIFTQPVILDMEA